MAGSEKKGEELVGDEKKMRREPTRRKKKMAESERDGVTFGRRRERDRGKR